MLAKMAVDLCFRIHSKYGPGLFESVYEELFCYEWSKSGILFERQRAVSLIHESVILESVFKADVILLGKVILEFKSVDALHPVHFKQLLTYLKLTGLKLGLLVNFNTLLIKDGIHRVVNNL